MRGLLSFLVLGVGASGVALGGHLAPRPSGQARSALDDIVGVWQSDTVSGFAARSTCAPSPAGGAVVCEQTVTSRAGTVHALNLFTFDSAGGRYLFYGLSKMGDTIRPVRLTIANHVWVYGGDERFADGRFHRTVNDFTNRADYSWRLESSTDSVQWTPGMHGRSRRVRP